MRSTSAIQPPTNTPASRATVPPTVATDLAQNGLTAIQDSSTYTPVASRNAIRKLVLQAADFQRPYLLPAGNWVLDTGANTKSDLVLEGIWAAAPYLHNGSVPNLWALLQPVEARPKRFFLGSNQLDTKCVGLTADVPNDSVSMPTRASTTGLRWEFVVPDGPCPSSNGNGNCGHRWGVSIPDAQKWALIEYLKSL